MAFVWSPNCCCEGAPCPTYADGFDRADSTDLGPDWDEESGDWEIKSFQLYEPGTPGAIAVYGNPVRTNYMAANIRLMNEALGGTYHLYIAWADASNHIRATYYRWPYDAGTNPGSDWATLSLYGVVAGVQTLLDTLDFQLSQPSLTPRGFAACQDYQIVQASVEDNVLCHVFSDPVAIEDGYYGAVGHSNQDPTYFDDWSLLESTSEEYDDCPPCWECGCGGKLPPRKLVATYYGEGACDTLSGITCDLDLAPCGADALARYDGTINCGSCIDGVIMSLRCGGLDEDATAWRLTLDENYVPGGLGCAEGTFIDKQATAASTCDPFMLDYVFGPGEGPNQICPDGCFPCGEPGPAEGPWTPMHYHIVITERP